VHAYPMSRSPCRCRSTRCGCATTASQRSGGPRRRWNRRSTVRDRRRRGLLLYGSRGYGPVRAVLLGGVSTALAHRCACPLVVVPRGHAAGLAGGGHATQAAFAAG
jgi:hypothetical protein